MFLKHEMTVFPAKASSHLCPSMCYRASLYTTPAADEFPSPARDRWATESTSGKKKNSNDIKAHPILVNLRMGQNHFNFYFGWTCIGMKCFHERRSEINVYGELRGRAKGYRKHHKENHKRAISYISSLWTNLIMSDHQLFSCKE